MSSPRKHEILTRSLRKMERTLDTVLRSLGNPALASGILSRSPSPSLQTQNTQALINSPSPPPSPDRRHHRPHHAPTSPKLHSLPEDALNPLGLLAEASLANRRSQANTKASSSEGSGGKERKVGVASDVYFKPGMSPPLPSIRYLCCVLRVAAPRAHVSFRPDDDPAATATVHRATGAARDAQLCQHGGGRRVIQNVSPPPCPLAPPPIPCSARGTRGVSLGIREECPNAHALCASAAC